MGTFAGTLKNKKAANPMGMRLSRVSLAERVGFEPTVTCATPDFESGTFGHSATSPAFVILAGSVQAFSTVMPPM